MASKTKKVWTNDVIEELIEMVEARSVIWNIKSKEYCDRDKRTSILSAFFPTLVRCLIRLLKMVIHKRHSERAR
jgi:hypothetical protein